MLLEKGQATSVKQNKTTPLNNVTVFVSQRHFAVFLSRPIYCQCVFVVKTETVREFMPNPGGEG